MCRRKLPCRFPRGAPSHPGAASPGESWLLSVVCERFRGAKLGEGSEQGWGGRAGQVPMEDTGRHCFRGTDTGRHCVCGTGECVGRRLFSTLAPVCVHANTCVCGLVTRSSEVLRYRWWGENEAPGVPFEWGSGALGFAQLHCCGQPSVWHVCTSTLMPCRGLGSGCPSGEHIHEAVPCLKAWGTWAQLTPKAEPVCPLPAFLPCPAASSWGQEVGVVPPLLG